MLSSAMFLNLLLCAVCLFVSSSSAVFSSAADETAFLQVTIPDSPPVSAILGGSLTLPCLVSLSWTTSLGRHAVLTQPRVKWSFLSSNRETEILVARGEWVKVSELYKGRASLLNYAASSADLTLRLDGLIHNDTGFYRCKVQHGLEDAYDQAQVKVKGSDEDVSSGERELPGNGSSIIKPTYADMASITLSNVTDIQEIIETNSDDDNHTRTVGPTTSLEVTFLPHGTQSPFWQTVPSSTNPGDFRADVELSGEAAVTTDHIKNSTNEETAQTQKPSTTRANNEDDDDDDKNDYKLMIMIMKKDVKTTPESTSLPARPTPRVLVRTDYISDACLENPCKNGGTCVDSREGHRCLCLPTYGGDVCETDLEHCEPGWEKFQGFCYRHFTKRQKWDVAEQHCRMGGGHLISVMSPEEQKFINDKYRKYQWTGLNDKTIEGDFRWSDGNPLLYENWYHGQPDSYFLSGEDCVVMVWYDDGHWSDIPCNYQLSYTCKKGIAFCGQPPLMLHTKIFGRRQIKYRANSQVRYYCEPGFIQRQNPIITCQSNGQWEEPKITCSPVGTAYSNRELVTWPTGQNKEITIKETTKKTTTPEYLDIKWHF
ncbi:brevican core protein-like [Carassius gibelio]|uniref:brevican core protein-like n=1 Tax=Carassius gibelio TaxID=101364 RepID=UPI00227831BD|nr:brevican core protein-like [Carassius gibelio]